VLKILIAPYVQESFLSLVFLRFAASKGSLQHLAANAEPYSTGQFVFICNDTNRDIPAYNKLPSQNGS